MLKELSARINPLEYEEEIYQYWLDKNYFRADPSSSKPPYTIVIPPPNITGSLHMGHALDFTIQDILSRFHRLKGYEVLWLPGTDHAGIATQNVVEKELAKDGIKKEDIGREKFIEYVWEWKKRSGDTIINQLKRLGSSCDWSKLRFTMDDGLSDAVKKVFISLYNENLIYRSNYMVNWCVRCHTAISDLEVEFAESDDYLYHLRYPLSDDSSKYIEVATSRPETFFADTAVAINPTDPRYTHLKGKSVILPIINKIIPIIEDEFVDIEFGTGAVKITPAHDPNDFIIGKKHNLDMPKCIDSKGKIIKGIADGFDELDRYDARKKVIDTFQSLSLMGDITPLKHNIGKCYRCSTTIEPMISMQWFLDVKSMAKRSIDAVTSGETKIIPSNWENTYFEWMNNIRDWCISRQIWWGHRIPAYYCDDCNEIIVSLEPINKCNKCSSTNIREETDVLDTWFSSALWPFSTLGYPEETELLKKFYPTSVLVTGFDILFFWVARMMMMGLKIMDQVPFKDIYLHALVRDEHGNKMSKSRGNVIDPLTVIDQYGTDALRFTIAIFAAQGRDIKLNVHRIEGYRNFINKIWNATRFIFMNLEDKESSSANNNDTTLLSLDHSRLLNEDKWILMQFQTSALKVSTSISSYDFNDAASEIYNFFWLNFCDYYLEIIKPRLYSDNKLDKSVAITVAKYILDQSMIMMHPIIPFITEHIFKRSTDKDTITFEQFPDNLHFQFEKEHLIISETISLINIIRNIRGEYNISPAKTIVIYFISKDDDKLAMISSSINIIKNLAKVSDIILNETPDNEAVSGIGNGYKVMAVLDDMIDINDEIARLEKELAILDKDFKIYGGKLKNETYLSKAKEEIITKDKAKFKDISSKIETITETLLRLRKI